MAALDGFGMLRCIGEHPESFPALSTEAGKTAVALVTKQLKALPDTAFCRRLYQALGPELFQQVVSNMKDTDVTAVLKKLDKNHPELKTGSAAWKRKHLCSLSDGAVQPAPDFKAARKKLTAKGSSLSTLKEVAAAFSSENIRVILDGLTDAQVKSILKKIDKQNPRLNTAADTWRRGHLLDITLGTTQPVQLSTQENEDTASPWSTAIDVSLKRK